jgi:hypothetical protein
MGNVSGVIVIRGAQAWRLEAAQRASAMPTSRSGSRYVVVIDQSHFLS